MAAHKVMFPDDGSLILALGFHAALRKKPLTDNPYLPGRPKFRTLDGSDLVWEYGWNLAKQAQKTK